jgi:hypothetical protein
MSCLIESIVQLLQCPSILPCQILSSAKKNDLSGQEFVEAGRVLLIFLVENFEVWKCEQQTGIVDVGQVKPSAFGAILEFPEVCLPFVEFAYDFIASQRAFEITASVDGYVSERRLTGNLDLRFRRAIY